MNEELKQRLVRCMDHVEVIIEQVPLVSQEIIAYAQYRAILGMLFSAVMAVVAAALFRAATRSEDAASWSEKEAALAGYMCVASMFLVVVGFAVCFYNADILLKTWSAPRLFVIDEMRYMCR